jgi:hypothetical protein
MLRDRCTSMILLHVPAHCKSSCRSKGMLDLYFYHRLIIRNLLSCHWSVQVIQHVCTQQGTWKCPVSLTSSRCNGIPAANSVEYVNSYVVILTFPLTFCVCSTQVILRKGDAGALSPRGAMLKGLLYVVALTLALCLRWQTIRTPISCLQ